MMLNMASMVMVSGKGVECMFQVCCELISCVHLLAVNIVGVACRGLWCVCGWKDVGMAIRKSIAV